MFEYDHSLIRMTELHKIGVRSTRELEEVIEGHSFADEKYFEELGFTVIRFIGFNSRSLAIKVAARLHGGLLQTLDVGIPTVDEIINDFCRYC